jgi:hypothetical protein
VTDEELNRLKTAIVADLSLIVAERLNNMEQNIISRLRKPPSHLPSASEWWGPR